MPIYIVTAQFHMEAENSESAENIIMDKLSQLDSVLDIPDVEAEFHEED